ncbi:MAG: cupin domain-containing protein [Promethearchaeota archaeon]
MSKISLLADLDFSSTPKMNTLLTTPNFNVARVCIPKGVEIPPHPEPNGTYFIILEGSGIFTRGDETFELQKNESLYINADQNRGIKCLEDLVFLGIRDLDRED